MSNWIVGNRNSPLPRTASEPGTTPETTARPDHLAPRPIAGDPLTGPLHTVSIITPDLPAIRRMYCDAMGMSLSASLPISEVSRQTLSNLWGMPQGLAWDLYLLNRPGAPTATRIRVIATKDETLPIRQSWSRQELGPYGMGFPNIDVEGWDKHVMGLGYTRATAEVERFPLKRTDGSDYEVLEATFNGPEFLRAIAISRQGMAQVGDVDPVTGRGGPGYATQVVAAAEFESWISFFTDVLDFEVRMDRLWKGYEIPFRFATIHAQGSKTGHVALASYADKDLIPGTGHLPAPPHRGMAMWSFPVKDMQVILRRAEKSNTPIASKPMSVLSPDLGQIKVMTLRAPSGFLIEVFSAESSAG